MANAQESLRFLKHVHAGTYAYIKEQLEAVDKSDPVELGRVMGKVLIAHKICFGYVRDELNRLEALND